MKELLTISRLKAHRSCARFAHLRYDEQLEPVYEDRAKARFGTLFHSGKEDWELARRAGEDPLAAALEAIRADWRAEGSGDEYELARLEALMEGYHWRWHDEPWHVVAVETEFRAPLRNPLTRRPSKSLRLGGKIDGVLATDGGQLWLTELKTSTEDITPGSAYWRRLRLDGQISVYYDGAAALGYEVVGCLYDVARRPAHEPLRATPPEARKYTQGKGCKLCGGKAGAAGTGTRHGSLEACLA